MKIRAIAALLFILISVSAFGEGRIKITGYVRDIIPFPYRRGILSPLFTLVWDIIKLNVSFLRHKPICA